MRVPLTEELGASVARFDGAVSVPTGLTLDGRAYDSQIRSTTNRPMTAAAFRSRITIGVSDHLYLGEEVDIGNITSGPGFEILPSTAPSPDYGNVTAGSYFRFGGVFGASELVGPFSVAAEVAFGARVIDLETANQPTADARRVDLLLEGRVRVNYWLLPNLTLGATGGVGLRSLHDSSLGITLGYHFAAYGG